MSAYNMATVFGPTLLLNYKNTETNLINDVHYLNEIILYCIENNHLFNENNIDDTNNNKSNSINSINSNNKNEIDIPKLEKIESCQTSDNLINYSKISSNNSKNSSNSNNSNSPNLIKRKAPNIPSNNNSIHTV